MTVSIAEKYGYGTLATFIVSILSLLGISVLPCFKKSFYNNMLTLLTGLAVGTLFSDAMLHIMPEVLGIESEDSSKITVPIHIIRICVAIFCLYTFWLFEKIIERILSKSGAHLHSHNFNDIVTEKHNSSENENTATHSHTTHTIETQSVIYYTHSSQSTQNVTNTIEQLSIETPESKKSSCLLFFKQIKPTAWMLILSDVLHNLCDGLAIGASFSQSLSLGVSTTIAIICHEIPHEIADYAVFVKCGFKHWQALLINFATTITCFFGFYIGVSVSTDESTTRWILSVTAGMFFYISLVDLLPNLADTHSKEWSWKIFIAINVFMWIGFSIMFILVIFESKIKI